MKEQLDNVLLLATSHNVAKAYAAKLHREGLRPSGIVLLKWENDRRSRRDAEKFRPSVYDAIREALSARGLFSGSFDRSIRQLLTDIGWEYAEKTITDINDRSLIDFLRDRVTEKYVIFCGGGLLRRGILNCGKKFIHVHPGVVPDLRGADGLLWSALVENEVGMSAFFMNEGIDTGDIIATRRYDIPALNCDVASLSPGQIKDLLINHVDPHYRAETLASLFKQEPDPAGWETRGQRPGEGKTYYFMHDALLPQAVGQFFNTEKQKVS